jgi:myosin heavy subunit
MKLTARYAIPILCVALLFGAGCSRYKADLENAKAEIVKLKAERDRLSTQVSNLQADKSKLSSELKELQTMSAKLEAKALQAEQAKRRLAKEKDSLEKKSNALGKRVADLKKKNEELDRKVKKLEAASTTGAAPEAMARQPVPTMSPAERKVLEESRGDLGISGRKPAEKPRTPCAAVIEFMQKAQGIIRQSKGEQRARVLQQLQGKYEKLVSGAPKEAWKSALVWVKELSRAWDKTGGGDSVYLLLRLRNQVLKACKLKPEQAGF